MKKQHNYSVSVKWTGNTGQGTQNYRDYERNHSISTVNKPDILCSSDPAFRGDNTRYNPEELLLASLSSCHMLWYLHLCAISGVKVVAYSDNAKGTMIESADGGGQFSEVLLNPVVVVSEESMTVKATDLHKKANELCFIANSVNFPVKHNPTCQFITAR